MNENGCGGYTENYRSEYYEAEAANGRSYEGGANAAASAEYGTSSCGCGNNAAAAANGTGSGCRNCDLYWQGYMAGFYANNRCNRSDVARTAARAADWTAAAAANSGCSCNRCSSCSRCGSCRCNSCSRCNSCNR